MDKKTQYIVSGNKTRCKRTFTDEKIEEVLTNLEIVKDILNDALEGKGTITSGCRDHNIELRKVREIMYISLNLNLDRDETVRIPVNAKCIMTGIEKLYLDVFRCSDEMLLDVMPEDANETVDYILEDTSSHALSDREKYFLHEHYMKNKSLRDIGDENDMTGENVRRILAKVLRKLRHPTRATILKYGVGIYLKSREIYTSEKEETLSKLMVQKARKDAKALIISEDTSIDDFDWPVRLYNILRRNNINTVGDIMALNEYDIMRMRNLGCKSLTMLIDILREHNIEAQFMK